MQMTPMDRTLLGIRDYPPAVQKARAVWSFTRRWPTLPMMVLATLIFAGVFAGWLAPHSPYSGDIQRRHIAPVFMNYEKISGPFGNETTETLRGSSENIFGTDHAGRDVFSRMLHGARISLVVGAIALTSGFMVGTTMGIVSGFAGGWIDEIITRIVDIWQALPFLMVALVCVLLFGQSLELLLVLI